MGAQDVKSVDSERHHKSFCVGSIEECLTRTSYATIDVKEIKEVEKYILFINMLYFQNPRDYLKTFENYILPLNEERDLIKRTAILKIIFRDETLITLLKYYDIIFEKDDFFNMYSKFAIDATKSELLRTELREYFLFNKAQLPAMRKEVKQQSNKFLSIIHETCPKVKIESLGDVLKLKENYDRADAWKGL